MFQKAAVAGMLMAGALAFAPATASAQDQSIGINAGGFFPRGETSRVGGDTIFENLFDWGFDINDFRGGTIGGDYNVGIGDFLEAGVGINFYQRTVPSFYLDYTNTDGSDIEQKSKLRIIPVTAKISYFPAGRNSPVQPYVGAGVSFYRWDYSEFGQFVDFDNHNAIFTGTFKDSGTAVGPTVFGGVRGALGDRYTIGGEVRYQRGEADLDPTLGFAGHKLDLGGVSLVGTFNIRF
jgi:opacity protein-like surface antigen